MTDFFWTLATISLPLSLTIYLSLDFASTSKELAKKLIEVSQLSNEKQQILLSQNETLEQQVTQRTSKLHQSIHELKITQAQLEQSEQRQSQQILRLNEEVISRTEEINSMKQTLASDFHDETGNLLSAITRQASLLRMNDGYSQKGAAVIDNIIANSNQLYASSRHFLWNLNNDSNDPHKLFEYLLSFAQGFYSGFGISFSAENGLAADFPGRLLPFAPLNLIFIFKEAINNVAKHAGATEVKLQLTQQNEFFVFSLIDDGNWKEPDKNVAHHGLHNMEKRCAQNRFHFSIYHPGNSGTRVDIGAPFVMKPIPASDAI